MTILDNLKRSEVAVYVSKFHKRGLGTLLANAAADAITEGINSDQWKQYMALFCDTPEELERLTKPKQNDPNETYLKRMRAYILANAICSSDTGTVTANGVDERIDQNLSAQAPADVGDPAALRAALGFDIPRF